MIGPRVGVKCGPFGGGAVGISVDQLGPATAPSTTTLTATIVDATDPIIGGQNEVYTIQVTNTGSNTATSISVTVTLDASLTWVSQSGTGWTLGHSGQTVTATLATLAVGAANPILVTATAANSTATISTSISVTCGNASTVNNSASTTVNKVTRDATSLMYMPATAGEWSAFIAYNGLSISAPTSIYTCQDATSPLADANTTFPLAISGTGDTYQQSVSGWSSKAVKLTDGTTGGWRTTSASLPDPATTSCAMLAYVLQPAAIPAATRNLVILTGVGSPVNARINITTGFSSLQDVGGAATGATNVTGQVLPWAAVYNFTGSTCVGYTLADKLTPAFAAGVGKAFTLGSTAAAAAAGYLYAVRWDGAAGEISAANIKLLQQALGWSPTWT